MTTPDDRENAFAQRWLPLLLAAGIASPALFLRYLPTTDLPQHLAVASMWSNLANPEFGFAEFYELTADPILRWMTYGLQYQLLRAFAAFGAIEFGVRVFVFLSLLAVPVGTWVVLRALGKHGVYALLALPLVYNRTFFWGFASFELSVGLAFCVMGLLVRPRSRANDVAVALLSALLACTHIYGVALLLGFLAVRMLFEGRVGFAKRALPASPALVGFGLWAIAGSDAEGYGTFAAPDFVARLVQFPESVLGGWRDGSDTWLLAGFFVALLVMGGRALPSALAGFRRLDVWQRVFALCALGNALLYLALPKFFAAALFVHVRHAFLACAFLPLLVPASALRDRPRTSAAILAAVAFATLAIAWTHLSAFDREATSFDAIAKALPDRPRVLSLIEGHGAVAKTRPYDHFPARVQAVKGGVIHQTFPQMFWNLPLRLREDAPLPRARGRIPWRVTPPDFDRFFAFYDHLVTHAPPKRIRWLEGHEGFPYRLVVESGPWRLYAHERVQPESRSVR